jgi:hypothetical protein
MHTVLPDTCVWLAFFDPTDTHFGKTKTQERLVNTFRVAIPWPTMYETLRTKFVRKTLPLGEVEKLLKKANVSYEDDSKYRDAAKTLAFDSSLRQKRPLSMVDCMIRLMLDDTNVQIDALLTFNVRDFFDVYKRRSIQIIDY